MPDLKQIGDAVIAAVREHVAGVVSGISERLDEFERRLAAVPAGERGEKGDAGERGEPGERGSDGLPGPPGSAGERGADGLPGERGSAGESLKGDPGVPGADGRDGADGATGRDGRDGLPGLAGKDGATGADGKDGLGLEDFDISLAEDGRTLSLKFTRGELVVERTIRLATMIYREVWREGEYERGDVVTWGGSAWHCQEPKTADKPSTSAAWKLMVKEGARGKDGAPAVQGARETVKLR